MYKLSAMVGASTFNIDWDNLQAWKPVLACADSLSLSRNSTDLLRLDLGTTRRWIAFQKTINGSPLACIGYQETVGAIQRGGMTIGGSNRKMLAWIRLDDSIYIGSCPR